MTMFSVDQRVRLRANAKLDVEHHVRSAVRTPFIFGEVVGFYYPKRLIAVRIPVQHTSPEAFDRYVWLFDEHEIEVVD